MEEQSHKEKWHAAMLRKYKTEEGIAEVMRKNGNKSKRNKTGRHFFRELKESDPDRLREISVDARKRRKYVKPVPAEPRRLRTTLRGDAESLVEDWTADSEEDQDNSEDRTEDETQV